MIENLYSANNYILSKKMLDASHIRHEALSNNIANAEPIVRDLKTDQWSTVLASLAG